MLIRFPQRYGDPIKSSYLLFTTPCWAVFSVAAWSWLRSRSRRLHLVLAAVAGLYVVSYATDLGGALSEAPAAPSLGGVAGYVDLVTAFQQNSPNPGVGGTIDFLAGVTNTGDQTASSLVLTVHLPDGMRLVGPPFYERGSGCTGTSNDHLRPRLPRRRLLDADSLLGAGDEAGAADDDRGRELGGARRAAGRQHGELHSRFSRRLSGVLPALWRPGLNSPRHDRTRRSAEKEETMTRFATTVTLVLALTGSTVGAALAARTDAPALQRAADRIAAASHPSRSIEHATPQPRRPAMPPRSS